MPDNKTEQREGAQVNQDAVFTAGVSEPYLTRPTTQIDAEVRLRAAEESPEDRRTRVDEEFARSGASPFATEGGDNTESLDQFIAVDPIYKNYGDVSHEPFAAEEGVEAELEKRALESMAERDENSRQATGGATTVGPAIEHDPVGRTEPLVRGGTGDAKADREAVQARNEEATQQQQQRAEGSKQQRGGSKSAAKE